MPSLSAACYIRESLAVRTERQIVNRQKWRHQNAFIRLATLTVKNNILRALVRSGRTGSRNVR